MIDEIHLSLEEILSIKQDLREVANIPNTIPFSAYYSYMAWQEDLDSIPLSPKYLDFTKNRYSENGVPCGIDSVGNFTRLSSATMWQDGKLVEVGNNIPRISSDGLLIEPQRTNIFPNSVMTTGVGVIPTTLEVSEGNVVPAVRFPQGVTTWSYAIVLRPNPCVISAYVKNSDNSKPEFTGSVEGLESDFAFLVGSDGITASGEYTVSRHGDVYRASVLSVLPEKQGNTGIIKYAGNSATDLTATYRQLEAGDTLTSLIKTSGTPATRSPDILIIDVEPNQYISGEWDDGVVFEQFSGYAKFSGQGYIRNIEVLDLQGRPAQ